MQLITDWHIHSRYSRACSKELTLPNIADACTVKGIQVAATGDWTHPAWVEHVQEELEEAGQGIYQLTGGRSPTRFMLVTEISQIYKRGDKTRRVHNLVFAPSLETVARVNAMLDARGFNRKSDGRPILGIDSEELYQRLKEIDERIIVVPAHAWTPWYAVFGSKSGFDSLQECFGSMTPYVYAIETGLSSDPRMNWQLSQLDSIALISNSDAHSLEKLGREANVFEMESPNYDEFIRALRERDAKTFIGTIEFYPEEGKYHLDGCAQDQFSCTPKESKRLGSRCPICKKMLTLGVEHRVEELADREAETVADRKIPYRSIVPLKEIIADTFSIGPTSKKVDAEYRRLTEHVGSEFHILLNASLEQITAATTNPAVTEAIRRVREGKLAISPGYDGLFGTVKIFTEAEKRAKLTQRTLL